MDFKNIIIRQSTTSVKDTMDRIQTFFSQHGATIYARINQQTEAEKNGVELKPLEYLLFGNPKVGGKVMAANPATALDLPLKLIVWEDTEHRVWVAYNEAVYIGERYNLSEDLYKHLDIDPVITKLL